MSEEMAPIVGFDDLGLAPNVMEVLKAVGYETPTPIQERCIPVLLEGRDMVGQAQTGTGKTAAFALPILSQLKIKRRAPQVLVLTPTRELAIQVSEAFQRYASCVKDFHIVPIYGGQNYDIQLRKLQRGVHVVVGTPGRLMDHLRRGTLKLDGITTIVLDEGDEMLRMGFIDDVEWIMEQAPKESQIALFSATMPPDIRRIARKYLKDPVEITIKAKTATADTVNQRYWVVSGMHKLDALTRVLEAEPFEGMLIFVRTRNATLQLSEKLKARGFSVEPLSGDVSQSQRERTVNRLKKGDVDIIVATDVAARGLDVERITHVINYDVPHDTESYVHRIGRTGRAGRSGEAILFISPREKRMLKSIENATNKRIDMMKMPSNEEVNSKRVEDFKQRITKEIEANGLSFYTEMMEQYHTEHNVSGLEIAAALAKIVQGDTPFLLTKELKDETQFVRNQSREDGYGRSDRGDRGSRGGRDDRDGGRPRREKTFNQDDPVESGMERFRIEVGHKDKVRPGNIVGAIANESGIEGRLIGRVEIYGTFSTVDLPEGMPKELFHQLRNVRVTGRPLNISRVDEYSSKSNSAPKKFGEKKRTGPPSGKGDFAAKRGKPKRKEGFKPKPKD
jgi:ATP-dependent RNA helicase DeaD